MYITDDQIFYLKELSQSLTVAKRNSELVSIINRFIETKPPGNDYDIKLMWLGRSDCAKIQKKLFKELTDLLNKENLSKEGACPEILYLMSICYDLGLGTKVNPIQAENFRREASKKGFEPSSVELFLSCIPSLEKFDLKTTEVFKKSKYPVVYWELGKFASNNKIAGGKYFDSKSAFSHYLEAANFEFAPAVFKVAECYEKGIGVDQNLLLAWKYYKLAVAKEYRPALDMFESANYAHSEEGQRLMKIAVFVSKNENDPEALWLFANKNKSITFGTVVKYDKNKNVPTFIAYSKAASMGHIPSQFDLANCYEEGIGTDTDLKRANELYRLSANSAYNPKLLMRAIQQGNSLWVEIHMRKNINKINTTIQQIRTIEHSPLGVAVSEGDITIVKILLDLGANPNICDSSGFPLNRIAIPNARINIEKRCEIAQILINHKANLNPTDKWLSPAFHNIFYENEFGEKNTKGENDIELLELFLKSGIDLSLPELSKRAPDWIGKRIVDYLSDFPQLSKKRQMIVNNIRNRAQKEVRYSGCTEKYLKELSEFIIKFLSKKIAWQKYDHRPYSEEESDSDSDYDDDIKKNHSLASKTLKKVLNRDRSEMLQFSLNEQKKKYSEMIEQGFKIPVDEILEGFELVNGNKNVKILFNEVFLPVKQEVLEFNRKHALLSGLHPRMGENSSVYKSYRRNLLFSVEPLKLVFKFDRSKPLSSPGSFKCTA